MQIAGLSLDNNIFLAPMAGISNFPYRRLMKRFGAGLVYTEMISADGLIRAGRRTRALLFSQPDERPLGVQLFGHDPAVLAEAASLVSEEADLLDLNFGCPVPKVVRSGAGSALLRDPRLVGKIVAAVRRATDRPLTVKIRSGWDAHSMNFLEVALVAVQEGADAVTLHPRTRAQGFIGRADWDHIRLLKETLPVPVIGSGDVFTESDALRMLAETGCDAVMIGRGSYGNPWLIRDILARLSGRPTETPGWKERLETANLHLDFFLETFGASRAVREMRKHLAWYSRGLPAAALFRSAINGATSVEEMRGSLNCFFTAARESA